MRHRIRSSLAALAILIVAIFTVLPSLRSENSREFFAGAGVADITPDVGKMGVPFNGYGARHKATATGIHDRLHAKALAMASVSPDGARHSAVIVTTDLCMVNEALRNAILEKIKPLGYGDDNFFFTATHTHSGPAALDPRWPVEYAMGKYDAELFDFTVNRIVEAIGKATESMQPAGADLVQGSFPNLVRNRRKDKYDYDTRRFTGEPSKDIDALMSVLAVKGIDGKTMAILVVFGSHATILGPDNMLISADWPGVLQETIEARLGSGAVAMFAQGAEGDQAPISIDSTDDFDWAAKYGAMVADAAMRLAEKTYPRSDLKLSAAVWRTRLPPMKLKSIHGLVIPRPLTSNISTDAIGSALALGDIAFLGLPGEPLHRVGTELRERAKEKGVARPVTVGLTNDWIGYISDRRSYDEGGYEATMTLYGPSEAEFCIGATLEALNKAQGK